MSELDERCPDCGRRVAFTVCAGHPSDVYDDYDNYEPYDGGEDDGEDEW